ncbi:MAG: endolytic transglycosylase MltG [Armatimonadetes bacterium]|nr:endolytic transglycosylase MltG [Armatimonadota bacterium]
MSNLRRVSLLAVFLLAIVALGVLLWLSWGVWTPAGRDRKVMVLIPNGYSTKKIARLLAKSGVIRSSSGFILLALWQHKSESLKPGAYELSPAMTPSKILRKIAAGDVSAKWVTFPEGFTTSQIAERLHAEGLVNMDRFYSLARTRGSDFTTSFPHPGDDLEGYLFPDTYLISIGSSEESIIQEMLDNFGKRIADLMPEIATSGMSLHEIVILASLIEREARISKDRPLISAVLRNRLSKGMHLECDATILYALGRHKSRLFYRDLGIDSPYNTYRYPGLPPGPIANPGLASIKAALHPANVDYLYYVAKRDGSHIFSRTLDEHNRAKQIARGGTGR